MLWTRRARPASGCRRRLLGVETTSASCARRGGTCLEIDDGRGSILTASPFSYSSTIGVPAANCCLLIKTWCMVPVPGIVRGKRGLRIRVRKKRNVCFYMEPRLRFYTRTRKFNNEVTNRRGKKDSFLNLTKSCIINGLTL